VRNAAAAVYLSNKHLTTPKHTTPAYITGKFWIFNSIKPYKWTLLRQLPIVMIIMLAKALLKDTLKWMKSHNTNLFYMW
jgi:hypothetical protein